jgi:hypothetical protein
VEFLAEALERDFEIFDDRIALLLIVCLRR